MLILLQGHQISNIFHGFGFEGGGVRKGIPAMDGIVGILGMEGNVGIEGIGGNVSFGIAGIEGIGDSATLGTVGMIGIAGMGGNMLGKCWHSWKRRMDRHR